MTALAMANFDVHTLALAPTSSLVNTAAEGLAIAALAWVLLRLAGRLNSGTRFAVWFLALVAIAALPFFAGTTPHRVGSGTAPITISASWALYLFGAWISISAVLFGRLGLGLLQMRRLRNGAIPVNPASLPAELRGIFDSGQSSRKIQLCVNDKVEAPAAFGFLKPAIVVPSWTLRDLPVEELKVILLHEMAHLRRWDDWTNLVQKVVKAVLFFHPAVWWIEGRLALEREMACDDMVLAQTASPKAYAASLISFAEKVQRGRELALAQSVVGRMRQISYRVAQILDAQRPSAIRVWKPVLGAVTVLSAAALVATPYAPQLVAFEMPAIRAQSEPAPPSFAASHHLRPSEEVPARLKVAPTARLIPARTKAPVRKPLVVRTSLDQRQVAAPVLVFMQSTQVQNETGSAVWTYCVWQVSGADGKRQQIETFTVRSI